MMRNILFDHIQPLRGWEASLSNNPAFHAGLLGSNPFRVLYNKPFVNITSTKSTKDFNITNSGCNLGYIEKSTSQLRKPAYTIWRSKLSVKTTATLSPKDFNIINPECNSGYKQKLPHNPEGVE